MSETNTTPAPTPETDKATVTTDWMTGKPVVPADFARRLERERDEAMKFAEKRDKELDNTRIYAERMRREKDADLTALRAVASDSPPGLYNLYVRHTDGRTKKLTGYAMTHHECCVMKSKLSEWTQARTLLVKETK